MDTVSQTVRSESILPVSSQLGLYTDLYELNMAQGYFLLGKAETVAAFDYFFRSPPFNGGYVLFAGLSDLLKALERFRYGEGELDYLASLGFRSAFLDYLRKFRVRLEIASMAEGEIVFPFEPILRVRGSLLEAQLIETVVLNHLNFESLIATKASRMRLAAGDRKIIDFGLRRAQGFGGLQASKAAVIGGVDATSNVYAAFHFDLKVSGTQAHSWIQSFGDELTAFRAYAELYPKDCVLLVDTYDTLGQGVPHAIQVARELEARGHRLLGIRLDSGDLAYLSKRARQQLDEAGLPYVKIAASNQLDEHVIKSLLDQEAPIDFFGIGTRLVTGQDSPALDGVYKLSMVDDKPRLKVSENYDKVNFPGLKKVVRYEEGEGSFYGDGVLLEEEEDAGHIYHPQFPEKHVDVSRLASHSLYRKVMQSGDILVDLPKAYEIAAYAAERLRRLQPEYKRFENPHVYKVGISRRLMELRNSLVQESGSGT